MIIIIEESDIESFNRSVHRTIQASKSFGVPMDFMYSARIIAKYENGEVEMIKNRYTDMEGKDIIESVASAFDRRKKIANILDGSA
jgi:hypothetical protein